MSNVLEVFRRVLVFRRIAAPDIPAFETHAQVYPAIAHLHALFANVLAGLRKFDLI
jgi:hypothetical protein